MSTTTFLATTTDSTFFCLIDRDLHQRLFSEVCVAVAVAVVLCVFVFKWKA